MAFRSPLYGHPLRNGTYYTSPSTRPSPPAPSKPKVVSIPVHFVGSDTADPSSAAIKIQRAVRGFLVRKNLKMVRRIEAEVAAMERRVKSQDEVDPIVREEKERLRINEMLMALLFRLDSVRGVRDYRKKVIRRVIMLQEIVDSISAVQFSESPEVKTLESEGQRSDQLLSSDETLDTKGEESQGVPQSEDQSSADHQIKPMEVSSVDDQIKLAEQTLESEESKVDLERSSDSVVEEAEALEEGIPADCEILETKEAAGEKQECAVVEAGESEKEKEGDVKDVILERMVVENEKLKGLVAELCQRSAQQCRLMGGLAERVEHLEKVVEKMERKRRKKRKDACSPAMPLDKKGNHSSC